MSKCCRCTNTRMIGSYLCSGCFSAQINDSGPRNHNLEAHRARLNRARFVNMYGKDVPPCCRCWSEPAAKDKSLCVVCIYKEKSQ